MSNSRPHASRRRRYLVALRRNLRWQHLAVAASGVALAFGMEALVTAAIAFFAVRFGFWPGMAAFTVTWLVAGLVVLVVTERLWSEHLRKDGIETVAKGWLGRWIAWVARRARFPATLLVAWFFGPLESPPAFLALGYRGAELALWEIVSAPIFCGFWFAWTVGGFRLIRALAQRLL